MDLKLYNIMKSIKKNKIIIFCGGKGTRIRELNNKVPKPLIKIKKKTIIERIMEVYYKQGLNNFVLLSGYKTKEICKYKFNKKYKVKIIYTGLHSGTAQRLYKIRNFLKGEDFFLTYGDTIGNFNLKNLLTNLNKKFIISMCTFNYLINKGIVKTNRSKVTKFYEKNFSININAGYYFVKKKIFKYIKKSDVSFELDTMPRLVKKNQIAISQNLTKWLPIDTKQDYEYVKKQLL